MVDLQRYRANSGKKNFIEQIKAPIFHRGSSSNRDNVRDLHPNLEGKVNSSILQDDFSSRTDPFIAPMLLDRSNKTS